MHQHQCQYIFCCIRINLSERVFTLSETSERGGASSRNFLTRKYPYSESVNMSEPLYQTIETVACFLYRGGDI